ncbi:MAG: hypothetical protein R3B99_28185 [Polyangiales bacterium]
MRIQVGEDRTDPRRRGGAPDHEHLWKVVGILKPTGTSVDRVVFINLDSFFAIDEHAAGALIPGTQEAGPEHGARVPRPGVHKAMLLSSSTVAGPAGRGRERAIRNLFTIVGSVDVIFLLVSVLVVLIGCSRSWSPSTR